MLNVMLVLWGLAAAHADEPADSAVPADLRVAALLETQRADLLSILEMERQAALWKSMRNDLLVQQRSSVSMVVWGGILAAAGAPLVVNALNPEATGTAGPLSVGARVGAGLSGSICLGVGIPLYVSGRRDYQQARRRLEETEDFRAWVGEPSE